MELRHPSFADILNDMATPGELVKVIAAATGTPLATVTQHDRNLVMAGLRTKGGRGTSAATVVPRDGSRVLLAVMGSEQIKDSVETVLRYGNTRPSWNEENEVGPHPFKYMKSPALDALPIEHSLVDLVTTLIDMATDDRYALQIGMQPMSCMLQVGYPQTYARLFLNSYVYQTKDEQGQAQVHYDLSKTGGRGSMAPAERSAAIRRVAEIYAQPIWYIGALLGNRLHKLPKLKGFS